MAENNSPGVKLIIKGCSFERQFGKPVVWESTRRAVIKSSGELSCTNLVVVYLVRGVSKSITPRSQSFITAYANTWRNCLESKPGLLCCLASEYRIYGAGTTGRLLGTI
jgi:hypothetical protein